MRLCRVPSFASCRKGLLRGATELLVAATFAAGLSGSAIAQVKVWQGYPQFADIWRGTSRSQPSFRYICNDGVQLPLRAAHEPHGNKEGACLACTVS